MQDLVPNIGWKGPLPIPLLSVMVKRAVGWGGGGGGGVGWRAAIMNDNFKLKKSVYRIIIHIITWLYFKIGSSAQN